MAGDVELRVLENPVAVAAMLLAAAAAKQGHVALSGGSTVGAAYELAARLQPRWTGAHVWFGDERAVPPDDERSNYRLVRATLLESLAFPPEVHRIHGERPAEEAAARYDAELDGVTLDVALNGVGSDGHTASLFPKSPALDELERRAVAAEPGLEPFVARVTMTPPVFAAAKLVVYLVTGADKAEAVRRAFAEEPSPATPASLVRGATTIALLDQASAALL